MRHEVDEFPVLVVGAGPVGLGLVGDLGWRGVKSLLVEARSGTIFQPKMDMVGIRTMELCRRWGIADDVRSAGYNRDFPQDCAWVTDLQTFEFGREAFPSPAALQAPPDSPEHRERCPQNFFDPVLSRFARANGTTDIRYRTELVDFVDTGVGVVATLRDQTTGENYQVRARYLIGADGGQSTVREKLGISMSGEGALTYTTNAIIRSPQIHEANKMAKAYRYIFIGEEGTWATLVAIDGYDNWRFSLIGDANQREVTEAEIRLAVIRAVGADVEFEILSILPWTRRQLVADSYRAGNVFLAGDAAHLTSPTGGFGMNTGILDAVNLSWKLEAVLTGWAGDELLDTYEFEQRPVAVRNVNEAGDNLKRMLAPRLANPDPVIFHGHTPEADAARKDFGDAYTEAMSREWHTTGIHLGYLYEASPVVVPDGSAMRWPEVSRYRPSARPGARAPHVWLSEDRSILDLFGRGFVLLRFDPTVEVTAVFDHAATLGIPLRVEDIDHAEAFTLYETALALVRPDGHVAWRADTLPDDVEQLLRTVTARSQATAPASV